ncbi:Sugar or nucleoside kinase, ribokinase family [Mariniphaga anaerophila]|uniref:Sugar or nucleoside kinase, ribokinase family n=1 Tax=Mariniphaga anaerophila TaxID=1484053 RepID=A0A1M4SSV4_9BACT|nr:carbohydrate kinase family protein [Mariniphaga anaerophila]SHE35266.1 Sugar or nucleoside kinase, ribokinase family [Mariniphaga anaerophila]
MSNNNKKVIISGTGCALGDIIYTGIRFDSHEFKKYLSQKDGDGGILPGKLVFKECLEKFSGKPFSEILTQIVGDMEPDAFNPGGPGLVPLVHASQVLDGDSFETRFYGIAGNDKISEMIFQAIEGLPFDTSNYNTEEGGETPSTHVFSDPTYNGGQGERSFVNSLGTASVFTEKMLGKGFFEADIVCLGGTALVPQLHDNLGTVLGKARENGCVTVVNTVYDFLSEMECPGRPWPLVPKDAYRDIDLLIMDMEEALRISGQNTKEKAIRYFAGSGARSFIITDGVSDIAVCSKGGIFLPTNGTVGMPVSKKAGEIFSAIPARERDTTGCGDNFVGGAVASVAMQLGENKKGRLDLIKAAGWGIVSGGFACSYKGGVYHEAAPGGKRSLLEGLYHEYKKQAGLK